MSCIKFIMTKESHGVLDIEVYSYVFKRNFLCENFLTKCIYKVNTMFNSHFWSKLEN